MKNNYKKDKLKYKNSQSRIVVRFRVYHHFPNYNELAPNHLGYQDIGILLKDLLQSFAGIKVNRLFTSIAPERIIELVNNANESDQEYQPPDFLSYYVIDFSPQVNAEELLKVLLNYEFIEDAYIQCDPTFSPIGNQIVDPHFEYQGYLNPAPQGIDTKYAWTINGGDGNSSVKFIDIEQGWLLDHEDFAVNMLPLAGINHSAFGDHGAAVLGIITMRLNVQGGIGITPMAFGNVVSLWRPDGSFNSADAIMAAIVHLVAGDIILLEAQSSDSTFSNKLWPLEIHEATFQAIRLASALGIIVIEAGGNGNLIVSAGNDLDKFIKNGKNILNPESSDFKESGAIIVAAASSISPHTRINYSNYGKRINCYAWGEKVATAGSYPRTSGYAINTFTRNFSGTSSASAIIAGAAIALQSVVESNLKFRLSPFQMRFILSDEHYGTASENGHSIDKIGVMPDLKKLINKVLENPSNLLMA